MTQGVGRPRELVRAAIAGAAAVERGVLVGFAMGATAALVPTIAAGRISGEHVAWAMVAAVGAAWAWAVVALPLAMLVRRMLPIAVPWREAVDDRAASRTATIGALVVVEIGIAIAAADFARNHEVARAIGLAALGVVVATVAFALVARARAVGQGTLRVAATLPAVVPLGVWWSLPDHVRAHDVVGWSLFVAAVLPYAASIRAPRRIGARIAAHVGGLACVVAVALVFGRHPGLSAALRDRHAPVRWLVDAGVRVTDVDGDGASSWFGGRDCAPFDPQRRSGADEIAGNGIDDNCLLGDLQDDAERVAPSDADGAQTTATNVLVVSVDALRPDRMSVYGYARPTTPRIAEAFADAIRFDRAYAEAASTRDTLPSVLTGRRLFELSWHRNKAVVLDPRTQTFAHVLAARGWHTFAVIPFVALNMIGATDLGFAATTIYDEKPDVTAPAVTRDALAAIDGGGEPFFGFVHYYEPHEPYRPHVRQRRVSDDPYDQEVATVDAAVGELVAGLRARGLLERTVLVLTSDHGEAFGEHGHRFHNEGVHDEDLRVPWLVRVPGAPPGTVAAPVSTTALVATLCDVLGMDLPEAAPPTVASVWPLVAGAQDRGAPVVASARVGLDRERLAAVDGDVKILFDRELSSFEVFDLAADPGERGGLDALPSATVDAGVALAQHVLEHVVGAAASRRRRAASLHEAPTRAAPAPDGSPPWILGAWAEVSRGVDGSGLPPRVLVHTAVRSADAEAFEVVLVDGDAVAQRVAGRTPAAARGEAVVVDVRTFKVYADKAHVEVELRAGDWRWSLGRVDALPVGR